MGITYKEYAWLINPAYLDTTKFGGVKGCPESYGFEKHWCGGYGVMSCNDCWNREISYPVIAEAVEDGNAGLRYRKGEKFKLASCEINGDIEIYHADSLDGRCFISDHLEDFKFYIDKEKKEAQKEFTKADLRDGMMCEQRNGDRNLWFNGEIHGINSWYSGISDDLTVYSRPHLDIVKVGYPDFDRYGAISCALEGDFKEIIWERKKEKEISSEEAFAVLKEHYGCDVKIKE